MRSTSFLLRDVSPKHFALKFEQQPLQILALEAVHFTVTR